MIIMDEVNTGTNIFWRRG